MIALELHPTFCVTIDRMKKESNALLQGLLDSKKECYEYLSDCFTSAIVECFQRMYKECLNKPEYKNGKNILVLFQNQLAGVPGWNQSLIMDEYKTAMDRACCTYIPSLIRATLVFHVKVHLMTNYSSIDIDKIKLRVPSAENFYHRCLIICAGELWRQPYLLYHKVRSIEQQHNLNEVESIAKKSIKNAIRAFIPIDQLLSNIQLTALATKETQEVVADESEGDEATATESESASDESDHEEEEKKEESESESSESEEEEVESEPDECTINDHQASESKSDSEYEHEATNEDEVLDTEELVHDEIPIVKTVTYDMENHVPDTAVCSVDKMHKDDDEREVEPVPEPQNVTKKLILGSMLINKSGVKKNKIKKLKPLRIGKSDSFF